MEPSLLDFEKPDRFHSQRSVNPPRFDKLSTSLGDESAISAPTSEPTYYGPGSRPSRAIGIDWRFQLRIWRALTPISAHAYAVHHMTFNGISYRRSA